MGKAFIFFLLTSIRIRKIYLLLFLHFPPLTLYSQSQEIQWACRVVNTNDNKKESGTIRGLLGVPNVYPQYMIGYSSWIIGNEDDRSESKDLVFVKVQFCKTLFAQQVIVAENYNPGAIKQIAVYDNRGNKKIVYEAIPKEENLKTRMFSVTFDPLPYETEFVTILAEPGKISGINCIDAIGICAYKGPVKPEINLYNDPDFIPTLKLLGPSINTSHDEYLPIITLDGNTLFFARDGDPSNIGKSKGDIWFSKKDAAGNWSKAENIGKPLNNPDYNFVASTLDNGNMLLLGNSYLGNGNRSGEGASFSSKTRTGWSKPENIEIANYLNNNPNASFFMANNKKVLLMAIEDNDHSFGQQDIYVSFHNEKNNTWSAPLNLGPDINTINEESNVFLAPDGLTMYFVSNGYFGYGGFDVYISRRLDDTWQKWTKPQNLGPVVNSPDDEMSFCISADGRTAYGYKYFNLRKNYDIYTIDIQKRPQPMNAKDSIAREMQKLNPDIILIEGTVVNSSTNKMMGAILKYENILRKSESGRSFASEETGYKMNLKKTDTYHITAEARGFFNQSKTITANSFTKEDLQFQLTPIEIGQVVKLSNLLFTQGKHDFLESSYSELDKIVRFLEDNRTVVIRIEGHTDNQGDLKKNLLLSEKRVLSVKTYLVSKGVESKRIQIKAFGGSKPIASNSTEDTRKLNRRVEFVVVDK